LGHADQYQQPASDLSDYFALDTHARSGHALQDSSHD
jgi:hypothetical protein